MKKLDVLKQMVKEQEENGNQERKEALLWALDQLKDLVTLGELDKNCEECSAAALCGYPKGEKLCLCEDSRLNSVPADRYVELAAGSDASDRAALCEKIVAQLYASGEIGGTDF